MSLFTGLMRSIQSIPATSLSIVGGFTQPSRSKWTDWRMLKDYKRRQMLVRQNPLRQRINSIRKNDILPREIREIADKEVAALPRDGSIVKIVWRCSVTSRPRATVPRWNVSRIVFRQLADYNKLAGVQRGLW